MAGQVHYAVEGAIARLTLDQQDKLNAMSLDMWRAVARHVAAAEADRAVRLIVVEGAGDKAFCAGADISQFGDNRTGEDAVVAYDQAVNDASFALAHAARPTIAAIDGICFGGGMGLAMSCDLRIASSVSRFRIPAARLGIGYGYDNVRMLTQRLGFGATAELLFSARVIGADEARALGVLQHVYAADSYRDDLAAYLGTMAENAPLSLIAAKRALIELEKMESEQNRAAAQAAIAACYHSRDYVEGQAAFRDKRTPQFRGE
jgi:enoyl-CoA hydratase/carnithine racemase